MFPFFAGAGRPVVHELDFNELLARPSGVISAEYRATKSVPLPCGWNVDQLEVTLKKVLRAPPTKKEALVHQKKLSVLLNPMAATDCSLRANNKSGASFSAERFRSEVDVSKLKIGDSIVLLIVPSDHGWQLVVDGAIFAGMSQTKIENALGK